MATIAALSSPDQQKVIDLINTQFQLDTHTLVNVASGFLDEYHKGLESYGQSMAMIPTFVTGVPDGTETGTFLALDLGGTNLRVCEVTLNGDKTFSLRQQKYKVSNALKTGEARALFDYLADSVDAFLTSNSESENPQPPAPSGVSDPDVVHLGLTFSFPVEQTALNAGKILTWTKGFSARNAVGNDVVKLLQDAFDRKHMRVKCVALVNDTVGAMLSRAYASGGCLLGAIFGTGTNGAYMEQVSNITKLGKDHPAYLRGGKMAVNTEWGGFNNTRTHLPATPFDQTLDRLSINPGFQAFEKFISGMYLGEIVRYVLTALIDARPHPILFGGKSTSALNQQWGVDTEVMSDVEVAWEGVKEEPDAEHEGIMHLEAPQLVSSQDNQPKDEKLEKLRKVVAQKLGFSDEQVSLQDAAIVRWVCMLVARRAALLSGAAVAATLIQTGNATLRDPSSSSHQATAGGKSASQSSDRFSIGVDGSLISFYPNFERTLRESLRCLVGKEVEQRVDIGLAKDGSGVGAALCALHAAQEGWA